MNSKNFLSALRIGNVPQGDIFNLCVARENEINEFKSILKEAHNSQSNVKFLNGAYGDGKSFFLKIIGDMALENNFLVSTITILPNSNIRSVYRDIMNSLISREEKSIKQILDNWIMEFDDTFSEDNQNIFYQILHQELYNSIKYSNGFISAIEMYAKCLFNNEIENSSMILSWICGEVTFPFFNNDDKLDEFNFLQALSHLIKVMGYSGFVVLIDDVDNVLPMSDIKRDLAYSSLKTLLDYCSLNKFKSSLFVFSATPECFENQQKGIPSYEALDDRLKTVLETDLEDMGRTIFNLNGFNEKDLKEIAGKLTIMHEEAYKWNASEKIYLVLDDIVSIYLSDASLTGGKVTPRVFIRSFISVLDTVQQNLSFFNNPKKIIELFEKQETPEEFNEGVDFEDIDESDDD